MSDPTREKQMTDQTQAAEPVAWHYVCKKRGTTMDFVSIDPECDPSAFWLVHEVKGGRNDREWFLIGEGERGEHEQHH